MKFSLSTNIVLGSMILAAAGQAHASNTYSSQITLTYTLMGITNLDNAGQFDDLAIAGSFVPNPDGFHVPDPLPANATVNASNNTVSQTLSPAIGSIFTYNFAVDGSNGSLDDLFTFHEGLFGIEFFNLGNDRYNIQFSLDYQFNAAASGEGALSSIWLDYSASFTDYNPSTDFAYFDSLGVMEGNVGPVLYNLTLNPQATATANAWVAIDSHLPPVPLPGAAWLFLSGAGLVMASRNKAVRV